jgi:hypothetical protein
MSIKQISFVGGPLHGLKEYVEEDVTVFIKTDPKKPMEVMTSKENPKFKQVDLPKEFVYKEVLEQSGVFKLVGEELDISS